MSKTYWLVSSNSIPTPEKKDKTLILHGVNAYEVCELKLINNNPKTFILSDTTLNIASQNSYPFTVKLSFKDRLRVGVKLWYIMPKDLKMSIIFIAVYLASFLFIAAYCPSEWSIYTAIISTIITFVSCFFPIFTNDIKNGYLVSILISLGIGILLSELYFDFEELLYKNPFLNRNRIGNSLTVLAMIFTFISTVKTTILSFVYDIRSNMQ